MFLLRDYPGYSSDFATREVDIRLRNTNGVCEIMLKKKIGDGENVSREEISLGLKDSSLDTARTVLRALGCKEARWMHRVKDVYTYQGVEWSLVSAPPSDIRYFEVEVVVGSEAEIPAARAKVEAQARELGLEILDESGSRELIGELNEKANKVVEL
jgi:predicted adenylyl cyclase CyaB